MVENGNQQQIYRLVRNHLLLPSGRGHYMDWEIFQSVEEIILLKSSCAVIQDNFGVPNTSLKRYLNLIFPPLKCSSGYGETVLFVECSIKLVFRTAENLIFCVRTLI